MHMILERLSESLRQQCLQIAAGFLDDYACDVDIKQPYCKLPDLELAISSHFKIRHLSSPAGRQDEGS